MGMFPSTCFDVNEHRSIDEKTAGSDSTRAIDESLVAPDEALKILSNSLSVERRLHYFENLSQPNEDMSDSDLPEYVDADMKKLENVQERAKNAWKILRKDWREVVHAELHTRYENRLNSPITPKAPPKFDIWKFTAENFRS
ncbi:hypothetical protein HK096_005543 [Nowakowskiella sp. JEL0078]|nr:hypothetical protein HK096_005543 [Nowakowskiella sp. JEL0078]